MIQEKKEYFAKTQTAVIIQSVSGGFMLFRFYSTTKNDNKTTTKTP